MAKERAACYLRHAAKVPIAWREIPRHLARPGEIGTDAGVGMRFLSSRPARAGALVEATLTVAGEACRFRGTVRWVRPQGHRFEIALRLAGPEHALRARLAEQACRIEVYRRSLSRRASRPVGIEQAAREWVERYAARFAAAWAATGSS